MTTRTAIAATLALLATAGAAEAGRLIDIDVIDRASGRIVPEYRHRGQDYIPGRAGHEFSVVLRNQTAERVLAVLSVDGVNAISGQTADTRQAGYVLNPYETVSIDGWRKSVQQTAAFYFTALPDSYAARTGRPDNVGVIGVAVFRERDYPQIPRWSEDRRWGREDAPVWNAPAPSIVERSAREERAVPAPAAPYGGSSADGLASKRMAPQPGESLGTGHGRREYNPVSYTEFRKRSNTPDELVSVYYDSQPNLVAAGIIPRGYAWRGQPQAFPNSGFAPDPY